MLERIKLYFNITDSSKDTLITSLIQQATDLQQAMGFSSVLIYDIVVWNYSQYLKSGNTSFKTSQASDVDKFPEELRELIYSTIPVRVFPHVTPTPFTISL